MLLWIGPYSPKVQWTATAALVIVWLSFLAALRSHITRPMNTISNLLAAVRVGDYSMRGQKPDPNDALGLVIWEINQIGEVLREQRLGAMEASALLRRVMGEIDVAVFLFDGEGQLSLSNRAGQRLLDRPARDLHGCSAEQLGLAECLDGDERRTVELDAPGRTGRYALSRVSIHQGGVAHELVVLSDVGEALREEERQAWKRLVRVLSHEINNSLAPINSIADALFARVDRGNLQSDDMEDLQAGLDIVRSRSASLARFMKAYAQLAKLPPPTRAQVHVADWIERISHLEARLPISVKPGPEVTIPGDCDQLDQLLINLVKNAVDAAMETGGTVDLGWRVRERTIEVFVEDGGPGLTDTANLFVPFFTTKKEGTGIGLALSRQIAEAHQGRLTLENRPDGPGCVARLQLPLAG